MKAYKKRSSYKSVDHWLDSVYKKNKAEIDSALGEGIKNKRASFKNAVKGYMDEGLTPEASLKALENSTIFTPETTRFRRNLIEGLKTFGKYNEFRKMIRGFGGRWANVYLDKFQYDAEQDLYYYYTDMGDIVVIEFDNSPEDIKLRYL